jgi:hypothetical protein
MFNVAGTEYTGRVNGNRMEGSTTSGGVQQTWAATRK